ncbi:MAG: relaxase, partial [Clostridiaceae bacterium]|nr:relaxase [Clostridiaceae bacterium]
IIRADVDEAIWDSVVPKQVYTALRQMGYEVNLNGKYIAVRLLGRERFTRLKTLGNNYTEEAIQRRVMANPLSVRSTKSLLGPQKKKLAYQLRGNIHNSKKITGLQALYLHYCYRMGILPKNPLPKRVHPLLKADLLKMDAVIKETRFLCKHNISKSTELITFKAKRLSEMTRLEKERTKLNNRLRRAADPDEVQQIKESRTAMTLQISEIRWDLKHVSGIEKRSGIIAEKLRIIADMRRREVAQQGKKLASNKRDYGR